MHAVPPGMVMSLSQEFSGVNLGTPGERPRAAREQCCGKCGKGVQMLRCNM